MMSEDWFADDPNPSDEELRRAKQLLYNHPQLQPFAIQLFARMKHHEQRIAELEKENKRLAAQITQPPKE